MPPRTSLFLRYSPITFSIFSFTVSGLQTSHAPNCRGAITGSDGTFSTLRGMGKNHRNSLFLLFYVERSCERGLWCNHQTWVVWLRLLLPPCPRLVRGCWLASSPSSVRSGARERGLFFIGARLISPSPCLAPGLQMRTSDGSGPVELPVSHMACLVRIRVFRTGSRCCRFFHIDQGASVPSGTLICI